MSYSEIYIKRLLYNGNITVWLVDGVAIRKQFTVNFIQGGHDRVYTFIPKGEIWVERGFSKNKTKLILLHEITERNLMKNNKMRYRQAHKMATKREDMFDLKGSVKNLDIAIKREMLIAK